MSAFSAQTLFRKKSVACDPNQEQLKPVLNAWDLTLMGIGAIIGTGIFVLTGHAAAAASGPAVVLSFILAGIPCAFAALAYAELAASIGGCGSAYGYSYAAFGEIIAWIIGWDLILEYALSVAAVANGWSGYFDSVLEYFHLSLPHTLLRGPFAIDAEGNPDPGFINLPAAGIILALMTILIIGVKASARFNTAMVLVKLLAVFVFIAVAIFHVNPDLWHPFMPFGWYGYDEAGNKTGIIAGASLVFFAYVGFDAVSTAAEETVNPQRNLPIGILASLGFCTVVYIIVSGLVTGLVPYTELKVDMPVAYALKQTGVWWAYGMVSASVVVGLLAVMLVLYYGLTRIVLGMSRDGLLPAFLGSVNHTFHTPVKTTVASGIIMAAIAGFIPLGTLAEMVNIGTLVAFMLVCGGVAWLRKTKPDMPRPYKAPGGIAMPIAGVIACGFLIPGLMPVTYWRFVAWLAVGIVVYFAYSARHSKARG